MILATTEQLYEFYNGPPPFRMKALAWVKDGKVVGLGGVYFEQRPIAFSELKPECYRYKKEIVRNMREVMKFYDGLGYPVYAVAKKPSVLQRFGFTMTGQSGPAGAIMIRKPQPWKQ